MTDVGKTSSSHVPVVPVCRSAWSLGTTTGTTRSLPLCTHTCTSTISREVAVHVPLEVGRYTHLLPIGKLN